METLVIVGAGGFGRGAADVVHTQGHYRLLGYLDDDPQSDRIGPVDALADVGADRYVTAIANPQVREKLDTDLPLPAVLRCPSSVFGLSSEPGPGAVIRSLVSVASGVTFRRHVHLNMNVSIGHDVTLGDYTTVHPGANISGWVTLDKGATVGAGAVVLQGLNVGEGAYVGAGAVVTRDVRAGETVTGVPAR